MYSRLLGCVFFVACCTTVHAETVSPESMAIAQILTAQSWSSVEQEMPTLVAGLEAGLKQGGASGRAAAAFAGEFRKAMTRQAVAKLVAQEVALCMSIDEQKVALAFFQTSAGKKLISIGEGGLKMETAMESLIDEVCASVKKKSQLSPADSASLYNCS